MVFRLAGEGNLRVPTLGAYATYNNVCVFCFVMFSYTLGPPYQTSFSCTIRCIYSGGDGADKKHSGQRKRAEGSAARPERQDRGWRAGALFAALFAALSWRA